MGLSEGRGFGPTRIAAFALCLSRAELRLRQHETDDGEWGPAARATLQFVFSPKPWKTRERRM